jgi:hypothetical protein
VRAHLLVLLTAGSVILKRALKEALKVVVELLQNQLGIHGLLHRDGSIILFRQGHFAEFGQEFV